MKKKQVVLWISIVLLLLSSPVYSQVKLGFQLGANFDTHPNFTSDYNPYGRFVSKSEGGTKFWGSMLVEFKISDMFYIQPEFNFLTKGAKIDFMYHNPEIVDTDGRTRYTVNYSYEIPINILAKFNISNFTPFIFAGPSFSFLSEAKLTSPEFGLDNDIDVSNSFTKNEFSINFGGGVEFPLSKSIDLFVMARYSLGITNIINNKSLLYHNLEKINIRGLAFATGIKFSI
jgi:opacity protein-like surface antigen